MGARYSYTREGGRWEGNLCGSILESGSVAHEVLRGKTDHWGGFTVFQKRNCNHRDSGVKEGRNSKLVSRSFKVKKVGKRMVKVVS